MRKPHARHVRTAGRPVSCPAAETTGPRRTRQPRHGTIRHGPPPRGRPRPGGPRSRRGRARHGPPPTGAGQRPRTSCARPPVSRASPRRSTQRLPQAGQPCAVTVRSWTPRIAEPHCGQCSGRVPVEPSRILPSVRRVLHLRHREEGRDLTGPEQRSGAAGARAPCESVTEPLERRRVLTALRADERARQRRTHPGRPEQQSGQGDGQRAEVPQPRGERHRDHRRQPHRRQRHHPQPVEQR